MPLAAGEADETASEDDWAAAMGETTELETYPRTTTLNIAERELAYWTGVIHALTGKVKAPNAELCGGPSGRKSALTAGWAGF